MQTNTLIQSFESIKWNMLIHGIESNMQTFKLPITSIHHHKLLKRLKSFKMAKHKTGGIESNDTTNITAWNA